MGEPQIDPQYQEFLNWKAAQAAENLPQQPQMYYVHLANGRVEVLDEEAASQSHYDGVRVIDKYAVGE